MVVDVAHVAVVEKEILGRGGRAKRYEQLAGGCLGHIGRFIQINEICMCEMMKQKGEERKQMIYTTTSRAYKIMLRI